MATSRRMHGERTGWRDAKLSERHRRWGCNVPATDIDFLLAEYDRCEPKALVEYKHERAFPVPVASPGLQAVSNLADRAEVPAFVVRYADDLSQYRVRALSSHATDIISTPETMSEAEYIDFLHVLRGRIPPSQRKEAG